MANGTARAGLPDGTVWAWIAEINFLHYAVLLFLVCIAVLVSVSLATRPPAPERIRDLTYGTATAERAGDTAGRGRLPVGLSVALAAILGVLWIVFA